MSQRAIIVAIVIFVLIVAGMFTFAYLKKQEMVAVEEPNPAAPAAEVPYASITRVDAKHFFAGGVHTIVGEIPMPTPCDLLEANARVAESMPEQVTIDFTVINTAEFCAAVVTPQRFSVTASASEAATFGATFMGRPIELNLVPALPGETPDDFELFIKG